MKLLFLGLTCLIGWIAALPPTHFDSVALERRIAPIEAPPTRGGGKTSGRPGSNPGTNEHSPPFTNSEGIHPSDPNTPPKGSSPVDIGKTKLPFSFLA